jgi:ethanolamine utilization protein EutM
VTKKPSGTGNPSIETKNPPKKEISKMSIQAVGILETKGLISLVQGTDAALKAANIELAGPMRGVGSALVSSVFRGDVAAVKAGIEAGAEAASQHGEVVSAHVIARPHEDTESVLPSAPKGKK